MGAERHVRWGLRVDHPRGRLLCSSCRDGRRSDIKRCEASRLGSSITRTGQPKELATDCARRSQRMHWGCASNLETGPDTVMCDKHTD